MIQSNNEQSQHQNISNRSSENMGQSIDREENVDSGGSNQNRAGEQPNGQVYQAPQHQNANQGSQQIGHYPQPVPSSDNFPMNNSPQQSLSGADEENKNNSDEEEDSDGQDFEDIESIMQYQHKILRKYAMLGMIQYSAIPFFHQLV